MSAVITIYFSFKRYKMKFLCSIYPDKSYKASLDTLCWPDKKGFVWKWIIFIILSQYITFHPKFYYTGQHDYITLNKTKIGEKFFQGLWTWTSSVSFANYDFRTHCSLHSVPKFSKVYIWLCVYSWKVKFPCYVWQSDNNVNVYSN